MPLRVRFAYLPGFSLGYSVERLADGLYYDFASGTFTATPTTQVGPLVAGTANFLGSYRGTIAVTPTAQFSDGGYAVTIHDTGAANAAVAVTGATMTGGDDGAATAGAGGGGGGGGVAGAYVPDQGTVAAAPPPTPTRFALTAGAGQTLSPTPGAYAPGRKLVFTAGPLRGQRAVISLYEGAGIFNVAAAPNGLTAAPTPGSDAAFLA